MSKRKRGDKNQLEKVLLYRGEGAKIFVENIEGNEAVTLTVVSEDGRAITVTLFNRDYRPHLDDFIEVIKSPNQRGSV